MIDALVLCPKCHKSRVQHVGFNDPIWDIQYRKCQHLYYHCVNCKHNFRILCTTLHKKDYVITKIQDDDSEIKIEKNHTLH